MSTRKPLADCKAGKRYKAKKPPLCNHGLSGCRSCEARWQVARDLMNRTEHIAGAGKMVHKR